MTARDFAILDFAAGGGLGRSAKRFTGRRASVVQARVASTGPAPARPSPRAVRAPAAYRLSAVLIDKSTKRPVPSVRVEAWDALGHCTDLLAFTRSDAFGQFTMVLSQGAVAGLLTERKPVIELRLFSSEGAPLPDPAWRWTLGPSTVRARIEVRSTDTGPAREPTDCIVRCRVLTYRGAPVPDAEVRVLDVGGEAPVELAIQRSETEGVPGSYVLSYAVDAPADIMVRVSRVERGVARTLAESPRYCHAPPTLNVDMSIGGAFRGVSEHEALTSRLADLPGTDNLRTATSADLDRIACRLDTSRDQLGLLSSAQRLAEETSLDEALLYGLQRAGLPDDAAGLLRTHPAEVRRRVEDAVAKNHVPATMAGDIEGTLRRFRAAAKSALLPTVVSEGTTASTGAVLRRFLPGSAPDVFVSEHLAHEGTTEDFWALLSTKRDLQTTGAARRARLALQVAALSSPSAMAGRSPRDVLGSKSAPPVDYEATYFVPLLDKLMADPVEGGVRSLGELARYSDAEFTALVEEVGAPTDAPGLNEDARKESYAKHLRETVRRAFPTTAIAAAIESQTPSGHEALTTFFGDPANEGFELGKTRVARHLATATGALARVAESDRAATIDNLKALERLFQITEDSAHTHLFYEAGIRSAADAHARGIDGLVSATGISAGAAKQIVDRACAVTGSAIALQSKHGAAFTLSAVSSSFLVSKVQLETNLGPPLVDWDTLFGSEGACQCDWCHSVLSPAAYLVDVLQFLKDIKVGLHTARTVLLSNGIGGPSALPPRRPDIANIDLTCPNTDTPLPYIDLVNEILEHLAAALFSSATELSYPSHIATTGASRDLLATPEILLGSAIPRRNAYTALATQPYPWSLPFHFWLTEARAFAPQLGVSLHGLMHALQPGGPPEGLPHLPPPYAFDTPCAWERLGLWQEARDMLVGSSTISTQAHWGFKPTELTWATDLLNVKTFLAKSGLTYDELRTLLDTQFIRNFVGSPANPNPVLHQAGTIVTCDLSKIAIQGLPSPATAWDALHGWLRLRRFIGWTIDEMDYAGTVLATVDDGHTDPDAPLRRLALVEHLRVERNVDLSVVLSWFGLMDTRPRGLQKKTSFYERVFQNPAVRAPVEAAFDLAYPSSGTSPTALVDPSPPLPLPLLGDHAMAIRAALRLSADDFALLSDTDTVRTRIGTTWPMMPVDPIPTLPGTPPAAKHLTLANLSTLHRIATWARALQMSIQDMLAFARLWGLTSFDALTPKTVYVMSQAADRLREGGLKPSDLLFVLYGLETSGSKLVPSQAAVEGLEAKLGTALVNVRAAIEGAIDPKGEQLRAILGTLLVDSTAVDYAMAIFADANTGQPTSPDTWFDTTLAPYFAHTDASSRFFGTGALESVEDRFAYAYGHLRAFVESEKAIAQTLGAELRVSPVVAFMLASMVKHDTTTSILERCRLEDYASDEAPAPEVPPTEPPLDSTDVMKLHRVAAIVAALKVTPDELFKLFFISDTAPVPDRLIDLDKLVNGEDEDKIPLFRRWLLCVALWKVRAALPGGRAALVSIFPDAPGTEAAKHMLARAATVAGWAPADVDTLAAHFGVNPETGMPTVPDVALLLTRFHAALTVLKPFRTEAATAIDQWLPLGAAVTDDAAVAAAADASSAIVRAVKARYSDNEWPDVARPLRDTVREKQRDALVAYILSTGYAKDVDELYAWLLVDTETAPAVLTSRIKQAMGSVQTFMQRAQLGLEPNVALTRDQSDQWKWMKNYRVWEANRKVFLFPENWLEPALRDDKTAFFKSFESEIRRQEITDATAEDAFVHYLERVADVANLEVVAMHHDAEDVIHLIGRTRSEPRSYYYRAAAPTDAGWRTWTPWEPLDLDVQSDHFVLFDSDRALALVWATIEQKPNAEQPQSENGSEPPRTHLEIGVSLSERKNGRWSPPRTSRNRLSTESVYENLTKRGADTKPSEYDLRPEDITLAIDKFQLHCLLSPYRIINQSDNENNNLAISANDFLLLGNFAIDPCRLSIDVVSAKYRFGLQSFSDDKAENAYKAKKASRRTEIEKSIKALKAVIDSFQSFAYSNDPATKKAAEKGINKLNGLKTALDNELKAIDEALKNLEQHAPTFVQWTLPPVDARILLSPSGDGWLYRGQASVLTVTGPVDVKDGHQITPLLTFGQSEQTSIVRPLVLLENSSSNSIVAIEPNWPHPQTTPMVLHVEQGVFLVERIDPGDPHKGYRLTSLSNAGPCEMLTVLRRGGIDALLNDRNLQATARDPLAGLRGAGVKRWEHRLVPFAATSPSSIYNWEVFLHAPLFIAVRLMAARRYDDARKWFERIFDPTQGKITGADANKTWAKPPYLYWKPLPFYMNTDLAGISEALVTLDTDTDDQAKADLEAQIEAWRDDPFKPYVIARLRTVTFQKAVLIKYLQNLIAWGDELFRRETIEAINEATGLYILARDLLGARPPKIAPAAPPTTYTAGGLVEVDDFGNALVETESLYTPPRRAACTGKPAPVLKTQYFCVPGNDKLDELWDTIADRLFKIRHSMNIEGVFRELALFEPPIDPALLVAAAAAGVDLDSVLNDLSGGRLPYRYQVLYGRAVELTGGVVQLGQSLLAALEKRDGEELSLLRSGQEVEVLKMQRATRVSEVKEAAQSLAAVKEGVRVIEGRRDHYLALIANGLIDDEKASATMSSIATALNIGASVLNSLASAMMPLPDLGAGMDGLAPLTFVDMVGGEKTYGVLRAVAEGASQTAMAFQHDATRLATNASYARRLEDWAFQVRNANAELTQSAKQVAAGEIRLAIAQANLDTHNLQTDNAKSVDEYMRSKLTGADLYEWMADRLMDVYYEAYKLAYDMAKRAERAMRTELAVADSEPRFIGFGYWDSARKGLAAGEQLHQALRVLDVTYHERNKREHEIVKQFSLASFASDKLLTLRETGKCTVDLEEKHFDYDYPGHYLRRIKSVSMTIPAVAGPYSGVSARLTLTKSRMRKSTLGSSYGETPDGGDPRFAYDLVPIESMVTSSAQNDAGVFELVLRDDRYLPFEGAGAISTWNIDLPPETNGFDTSAINDVVLHVRYTARDGGSQLRTAATPAPTSPRTDLQRLFSAKAEFPDEWHAFMSPDADADEQVLDLPLTAGRFSYLYGNRSIDATNVRIFAKWAIPDVYHGGTALTVDVLPPNANPAPPPGDEETEWVPLALGRDEDNFGDLGTVQFPITGGSSIPALGAWKISAAESRVGSLADGLSTLVGDKSRLNDTLVDIFVLVTYEQAVG